MSASGTYRNLFPAWGIYLLALGGAFTLLTVFSVVPLLAVILADLLMCFAIVHLFPEVRHRWLLLLYPLLVLAISLSITGNWFDAGDGLAHTPGAEAIYAEGYWGIAQKISSQYGTASVFLIAKAMSPGAALGYLLAFYFFDLPIQVSHQSVFILSQGFAYQCFVGLIAVLIRQWKLLEPRFAFIFIAFLLLSPTALGGNGAPNRHLITMASVCLLLISHMALLGGFTAQRLVFYVLSIALVVLSKAPLLIPYAAFAALSANRPNRKRLVALGLLLLVALLGSGSWSYFSTIISAYDETRVSEMRMLGSGLMDVPVVGWAIKYLYAILSPFPWYKMDIHVETILSGSYLLFSMQAGSTLTGLYFLSVLLFKRQRLFQKFKSDEALRSFVLFGLIMSTSILAGATGFHVYLAIFFPFLAPLLIYKDLRIHIMIPVSIVMTANVGAFIVDLSLG